MAELDEAAIFNAARKIDLPEKREAYLRQACGANRELYEQVATLLAAYDAERDFLESPPAEFGPPIDCAPISESTGTIIGRYKLLEIIGEGGFAVVYMAEQTEPIRRQVALKIIKLGMDTRQVIARFEAERQALALMDHPGIAKVHDAGATETGRPYFVMQLIRGTPITQYCDENRLTTEARLQLFLDVCRAIQHAHQKGIIHRDIKPTNVLVALHDGRPVPKVIDFGIAKATHQRLTEKTLYTSYRQIIGTPQYMSPEQAEFSDLDIDTRSDIYSLGVLLYELLTSTTPFQPDDLHRLSYHEICHTILLSEPPTPSRRFSMLGDAAADAANNRQIDPAGLRKLLHGDLDWIIMKALEKDRAHRYETADALALDIERHLKGETIGARRISHSERLWRLCKRNPLVAALSLVVATLVLLIAITAPLIAWRQARLVDETRQQLYVKDVSLAYSAWNDGELGHVRELLDHYRDGSPYAQLRDFPWYYLDGLHQRATAEFMPAEAFDVSLNANLAAVAKTDNRIHLYDLKNWSEVGALPWECQQLKDFRLSSDGRLLAAAMYRDGVLSMWDLPARKHLYSVPLWSDTARHYTLGFSPDGRMLAAGGPDHAIKILETSTGKLLRTLRGQQDDVTALTFSPDGKTLATAGLDFSLHLWDTSSWEPRTVIKDAFGSRVFGIAYDPTGSRLAAGGWDNEVKLWGASGRPLMTLPSSGYSLCFSPDGHLLATGGELQGTVYVWNVDERKLTQQYHVGGSLKSVRFLSDGELLISSDEKLFRRDVGNPTDSAASAPAPKNDFRSEKISFGISAAGDVLVAGYGRYFADPGEGAIVCRDLRRGKQWLLAGHDGSSVVDVAVAPAGERVVAAGGPGNGPGFVKIWNARSGQLTAELPQEKTGLIGIALSSTGERLAVVAAGQIAVWEHFSDRPQLVWKCAANRPVHVAFSPRGDVVAVTCWNGDDSMILDAAKGKQLQTVSFTGSVMDLAFSPEGRFLASIDWYGKVQVYDRHIHQMVLTDLAHRQAGMAVAFSPDGCTLATASSAGDVKFWYLPTMTQVATLRTRGKVGELAFFPDGKTLAVGYFDRFVELWHVDRENEQFSIDGPASQR